MKKNRAGFGFENEPDLSGATPAPISSTVEGRYELVRVGDHPERSWKVLVKLAVFTATKNESEDSFNRLRTFLLGQKH